MDTLISPYIIAVLVGFLASQVVKAAIALVQHKRRGFRANLFISGGMPSSHSATIMAVWTMIAIIDGPLSGLFGLASAVALIVLYDAVKVRRSSGEQGVALTALLQELEASKQLKLKIPLPRVAMGHTPAEVIVGAILGCVVGIVVAFILGVGA